MLNYLPNVGLGLHSVLNAHLALHVRDVFQFYFLSFYAALMRPRPIATSVVVWSVGLFVGLSVCLLETFVTHAKRLNRSRCGVGTWTRVEVMMC